MKISDIKKTIGMLMTGSVQPIVPMLKGKPGIGKSQIIKQIADDLGIGFIDLRISQLDSVDVRGIPRVDSTRNVCVWYAPEFLPFEGIEGHDDRGILFLDEMNRARPDVLQSIFQLVLDRSVGSHKIKDGWKIIAAGNLGYEDDTDVIEFDAALKNRLMEIEVELIDSEWLDWARKSNIHSDIINFIEAHSEYLYHTLDNGETKRTVTPRSWEKFSKILENNSDISPEEITCLMGPNIIHGAASRFIEYLRDKKDISANDVLFDYKNIKKHLQDVDRAKLSEINSEIVSVVISNIKTGNESNIDKAIKNLYLYGKDNLSDEIYLSLITALSRDELSRDFCRRFLRKYPDVDDHFKKILCSTI